MDNPEPQTESLTRTARPYEEFLRDKSQFHSGNGFSPIWMPDFLFDFQKILVDWSLRRGRSAIFADCGLGKTPISLVLWSNPSEIVFTPFMGIGSEVCRAV